MALDFKQKALLQSLLAEDPSAQQYLYNWNKLKTYDENLQDYYDLLHKAEGYAETKTGQAKKEAEELANEVRGLIEKEKEYQKGVHGFSTKSGKAYVEGLEDFGKEAVAPPLDWFSPGPRGGASGPTHLVPIEQAPGAAGKKDLQLAGTIGHELRHLNWTGEEDFLKMLQTPEFGGTEEDALKEQEELLARYYDMTYSPEKSGRAKEYIEDSPYYHEGIYDKLEDSLQVYLDSIKPEQKAGGGIIDLYRYGGFVG
tara:strand:+ start:41 stop:805 length:765 start_codon:yes stop_codon:yes gene_type:complete